MAVFYVRSTDGNDADNGTTWALAKATLAGALAIAAAGDRIWVSQVHAETQASTMSLASPGTSALPCEILCGNDSAQPPTSKASSATISTTGAFSISFTGHAYCYGITFNAANSTNAGSINWIGTASYWWRLERCTLVLRGTSSTTRINVSSSNAAHTDHRVDLIDCDVQFSNSAQGISCAAVLNWRKGSILAGGTSPASLIRTLAGGAPTVRVQGVDLTQLGNNALLGISSATVCPPGGVVRFEGCILPATVSNLVSGSFNGPGSPELRVDDCFVDASRPRVMQRACYEGGAYSDNTVIRTSGASDGATGVSHKLVSAAGAHYHHPLYGPEIPVFVAGTGSAQTAVIEIVHDSATPLTDKQIWLSILFPASASTPLSSFADDRADVLATAANQTTSAVAWTTTGLSTPLKQKLEVAFTMPSGLLGVMVARVAMALPSYTLWYDPLVTIV
jgi:hypothetical protein